MPPVLNVPATVLIVIAALLELPSCVYTHIYNHKTHAQACKHIDKSFMLIGRLV